MKPDNISKGRYGEEYAQTYLKKNNYLIIDTNWRCSIGEIDIIAEKDGYICFVEVKYRSSDRFGTGYESIDVKKQAKLKKLAEVYIKQKSLFGHDVRFDAVQIQGETIDLIENAF